MGRKSVTNNSDTQAASWKQGYEQEEKLVARGNACYKEGNVSEAVKLYTEAAKKGYADAQNMLALRYAKGEGVQKDAEEAFQLYYKAAKQGHVYAQFNLAQAYEKGRGTAQDKIQAQKWYLKAAKQGEAEAQTRVGNLYWNGAAGDKSEKKAVKWWKKAAEKDMEAQYNLGACYFNGVGVKKDLKRAFSFCKKSAEQGYVKAALQVARCYGSGKGTPVNVNKMMRWYLKAANDNNAKAAYDSGAEVPADNTIKAENESSSETPSGGAEDSSALKGYSCSIGDKHISFDAPGGFLPHEPMDAMYVHNQDYYLETAAVAGSAYLQVIFSEAAYEEALSTPTERTAEEYRDRIAARDDDFVGITPEDLVTNDVSFGDYSGYYFAYEDTFGAPKGMHNLTMGYSLFKGNEHVQVVVTYYATGRPSSEPPAIDNIHIKDE